MTIGLAKVHADLYYPLPSSHDSNINHSSTLSNQTRVNQASIQQDLDLWHFRLGHLSSQRMSLIHSHIPNVKSKDHSQCKICHLAKQRHVSFPASVSSSSLPFD